MYGKHNSLTDQSEQMNKHMRHQSMLLENNN